MVQRYAVLLKVCYLITGIFTRITVEILKKHNVPDFSNDFVEFQKL